MFEVLKHYISYEILIAYKKETGVSNIIVFHIILNVLLKI